MNIITISKEIRDAIIELGATDAYKCYQCGMCTALCPWFQIEKVDFIVNRIPHNVKLGNVMSSEDKAEIEKEVEELFRCVGCDNCLAYCPRGVNIGDIVRAIRRLLIDYEAIPKTLKDIVTKIYSSGNPQGETPEKRNNWANKFDVPLYLPNLEYAYFACCIPAYDAQIRKIAEATVKVLKSSDVSFGLVNNEVFCCSEAIRNIGAEKIFTEIANNNINALKKQGVRKLLVTSPHCYTAYKNDYKELGCDFEVVHTSQLFFQLLQDKKIIPSKPIKKKVVYHDPCTLGRQNNIYEEPRAVLKSIPELELLEIENFTKKDSVCCGAGGGGLWLDWQKGERMSDIRIQQAIDAGAEILAIACPYCMIMFEDSVKTMQGDIEIKDIAEILAESLAL
ncbi:MAG: (Fe-S)-binding protein [candidate division WOR-3 bacterium]|nr:(Fe-S)-binding protein [candidate division WOR-3 bacterium]